MMTYWNEKYLRFFLSDILKKKINNELELGDEYSRKVMLTHHALPAPSGTIIDRLKKCKLPFNYEINMVYQKHNNCSMNYPDVMRARMQQILKRDASYYVLFYSGGIDSVSVLISMLEVLDTKKIILICNHDSKNEYPSFYYDHIHNKIATVDILNFQLDADSIMIGTDGGDQPWGWLDPEVWASANTYLQKPWQDWMYKFLNEKHLEFVDTLIKESKMEIITLLELRVYFYHRFLWQYITSQGFARLAVKNTSNYIMFFDSDIFEKWSQNNRDKILGGTYNNYKVPAKEYIFSYHKDYSYFKNKTKERSGSRDGKSFVIKNNMISFNNNCYPLALEKNKIVHSLPSAPFLNTKEFVDWNNKVNWVDFSKC